MILKILLVVMCLVFIAFGGGDAPTAIPKVVLSIWGIFFAISFLARASDPLPHTREQFVEDWGPLWWHLFALGCAVIWALKAKGVY